MVTPASVEVPHALWAVLTNRIDMVTWKVDLLALAARGLEDEDASRALQMTLDDLKSDLERLIVVEGRAA